MPQHSTSFGVITVQPLRANTRTVAALSSANTLLKYLKLRELERAIARGERTPPESVGIEDAAALRTSALLRAR